jgi:SAM-dependent methyltransferase
MMPDHKSEKPIHQTCDVCNSGLTNRFGRARDPLTNESFSILACTKCGLGHTHPHPPDLSPYYGSHYYGGRHSVTARFCIRRRLRFLENAAQKRLLDVGCGDGSFLIAAKEAGWNVTGSEINPHPARTFNLDIRHNLDQIEDTEQFDRITMWHSLEHMEDIKSTLRLLAKLLAPKGRLIIAVPNNDSLQAKWFGPRWLHLDVPRHLYHFTPGSLRFSLENAGLHVYRSGQHEIEYDLLGWSQSALNYLNPTPNIFFDFLTGKGKDRSVWTKTSNFILGSILTPASIGALLVETLMGRSGTLVMTACRKV